MIPENCKVYISRWSSLETGFIPFELDYPVLRFQEIIIYAQYGVLKFSEFLYILTESEFVEFCLKNGESPIELSEIQNLRIKLDRNFCSNDLPLDRTFNNSEEFLNCLFEYGCSFQKSKVFQK